MATVSLKSNKEPSIFSEDRVYLKTCERSLHQFTQCTTLTMKPLGLKPSLLSNTSHSWNQSHVKLWFSLCSLNCPVYLFMLTNNFDLLFRLVQQYIFHLQVPTNHQKAQRNRVKSKWTWISHLIDRKLPCPHLGSIFPSNRRRCRLQTNNIVLLQSRIIIEEANRCLHFSFKSGLPTTLHLDLAIKSEICNRCHKTQMIDI